jgi:hypothetical protein
VEKSLFEPVRSSDGRAWRAEATVAAGGAGCPLDLAARLALVPATAKSLRALLASLPPGCAVLGVELPAGSAPAAVAIEAAGDTGGFVRCTAGQECAASGSFFVAAPVTRKGAGGTFVLAAFHSAADAARRAALVVETSP